MRLATWYAQAEDARRVAAAQLALWFAGAAPVVALAYVFAELALGHPAERGRLVVTPAQLVGGGLWMGACVVSGGLLGRRRAAGLYLGVALFGAVILVSGLRQHLLSASAVCAAFGLLLLARARRAVRADARASAA